MLRCYEAVVCCLPRLGIDRSSIYFVIVFDFVQFKLHYVRISERAGGRVCVSNNFLGPGGGSKKTRKETRGGRDRTISVQVGKKEFQRRDEDRLTEGCGCVRHHHQPGKRGPGRPARVVSLVVASLGVLGVAVVVCRNSQSLALAYVPCRSTHIILFRSR